MVEGPQINEQNFFKQMKRKEVVNSCLQMIMWKFFAVNQQYKQNKLNKKHHNVCLLE